jgi:hypothetical protein
MSTISQTGTVTLPFGLQFVPQADLPDRPALQSYSWMVHAKGFWLIVGGRRMGLHQFNTSGNNFPQPNQSLWKADPHSGVVEELLDLTLLDPEIGDPLMSTNQQSYYDREADEWMIVGGYGQDSKLRQNRTFDTFLRIPVGKFCDVVFSAEPPAKKAAAINAMVVRQHDSFFAVTGGALRRVGSRYVIVFGQGFQGAYNPFLGIVAQDYVNAVRFFRLDPLTREAIGMGEINSPDLDAPFHRRDGPVVDTLDPATGAARIASFGGVFPPGKLGGYMNPVYIADRTNQLVATTDRSVSQLFNHYECPVVVVWDAQRKQIFHTFFGGISRSYYHQTAPQKAMYDTVTAEGRNDGLPFVADISTLIQDGSGSYTQCIAPLPIPDNKLRGASVDFVPLLPTQNPAVSADGIVDLARIGPLTTVLIGHIYGGIDADFPLPKIPNFGSQASNALYSVMLTNSPSAGHIPASQGHLANGVLPPPPKP